jgi:flagellin-like protein
MKGVSPLIATVLLVVIVVIMASLITNFTTDIVRTSGDTVKNRTGSTVDCSGASIAINDVFLSNGTAGSAKVSVINNGLKDGMVIVSGVLYNNTGSGFSASNVPVSNFDVGEVASLNFANLSVPLCGNFSYVVVTTNCGGVTDSYSKAPKC